jgi:deoxyribose-phosphate aldolase
MNKFETLFAEYPCTLTDDSVKAAVADILANHFDENNNAEVWKQCLHSIDLTTLNGDDTTEKVESMAQCVNEFEDHFPDIPNVAAMCV